jgi:hypothetical protein
MRRKRRENVISISGVDLEVNDLQGKRVVEQRLFPQHQSKSATKENR